MTALIALTIANIKSYVRDRAALFWTLAFPLIFIVMFGFIFQGGGGSGCLARLGGQGRIGRVQPAPGRLRRHGRDRADGHGRDGGAGQDAPGAGRRGRRGAGRVRRRDRRRDRGHRAAEQPRRLHRPVAVEPGRVGLPGRGQRARHRQPRGPAAARRPAAADPPDGEPELHQLLRAEHARPLGHAGGHLRRHPARRRSREADPQAPRRDPAASLAAGRVERPDAPPDRADPGGDHHGRRGRSPSA